MIANFFRGFGKSLGWGCGLILVWVIADYAGIIDTLGNAAKVGMESWPQYQGEETK